MVEGIIWRYRVGAPWQDVLREFGPWQTLWKRHRRYSDDGTWDAIHAALLADADAAGRLDWAVSVDSTVNRAHQHASTLPREKRDLLNYTNLLTEPPDHAIGRSRGGLSTKIHHLVDGNAANGHGGNVELKGLDPSTFRYSLLRVFDPSTPTAEINIAESHCKLALDSRVPHGLNRN
ncbi:hypothetical protein GCM10022287_16960 [Gryllotalpicola koreensis]|uniref:Insertion element IS402-like domain-containing protein n=1 Tax=Gryllotalpicola koreensis TaxID=993086 RepID=A0ABP7ZZ98_9MICO